MMSSGKKVSLLSVVAVATAAAILFAKKPAVEPTPVFGHEQHETLARRLPAKAPLASGVQHVLKTHEDSGMRVPTASTPGSADPHVGLEFSPSSAAGYGRTFNPAGAMLEPRLDVAEDAAGIAAEAGPQFEIATVPLSVTRTHVVVDGDTLTGLAARYLGSSDRYREIFAANRQILPTPDLLPIGATLKIPSPDSGTASEPAAPQPDRSTMVLPESGSRPQAIVPVLKGAQRGEED
jgi:nucleoid-associated protein YgaU